MNATYLRNTIASSMLVAGLVFVPALFAQTAALDGRVFVGEAGEKGKPADEKGDVITFADGKFHSSSCDQYGYNKGTYTATKAGDTIQWETETTSEKDGRLVWKGTVRGSEMEGTFVHYRKGWFFNPNPDPVEHWFKAKAKS
ncbi:MAG TPA: hypothetical protein VLH12_09960 [Usitatibacter sp.]|nr:hypothetical protein [Usitatibacter sp.]